MAEYIYPGDQTINPGESVSFSIATIPCTRGLVRWRPGSTTFNLSGWVPNRRCGCGCNREKSANYKVTFGANVALPEGTDVAPINLAFSLDGVELPDTTIYSSPATANTFNSVERTFTVPIWRNCCQTISVTNTGTTPVTLRNAIIDFDRPDLCVTY